MDTISIDAASAEAAPKRIASLPHLAGFLLAQAGLVALGLFGHDRTLDGSSSFYFRHAVAVNVALYLTMIPFEIALLTYCWFGVYKAGGTLETLSRGRWFSWRHILRDVAIAIPFWLVLQGLSWIAILFLGPESVDPGGGLLPTAIPEVIAWICVSLCAGVCEELVYRGYLQQQLHAVAGNMPVAILGQGLIFGVVHSYQGWKGTIVISVIGILLGVLAAWRRNLRSNVVVHAWVDIWEGWLKFAI
jgi:membrane protease YdiL (CAAX protease family)